MELLILFLILALLFGLGGFFTAAKWLLIIAVILLLIGLFTGYRGGSRRW